ncbi:MAG: hypothetical protein ACLQLC_10340 [Candidatus Sulfotelmatobacter sp.]
MELFLNLAWVLLALPAYWLWQRNAEAHRGRRLTPWQCLLALGCALVLLFPVISASDDLHAMRAEMEDSATNKRTVRQSAGEKSSGSVHRLQGPPAIVASGTWRFAPQVADLDISTMRLSPLVRSGVFHTGRAPPPLLW